MKAKKWNAKRCRQFLQGHALIAMIEGSKMQLRRAQMRLHTANEDHKLRTSINGNILTVQKL